MSCDICISGTSGDMEIEFSGHEFVTEHPDTVCVECNCALPNGTKIKIPTYDEDPQEGRADYSTCLTCAEIREAYSWDGNEVWAGMWDKFYDEWEETEFAMAGECWQQLSAAAKQALVDHWNKWKGF